jgi:hypothetical protein
MSLNGSCVTIVCLTFLTAQKVLFLSRSGMNKQMSACPRCKTLLSPESSPPQDHLGFCVNCYPQLFAAIAATIAFVAGTVSRSRMNKQMSACLRCETLLSPECSPPQDHLGFCVTCYPQLIDAWTRCCTWTRCNSCIRGVVPPIAERSEPAGQTGEEGEPLQGGGTSAEPSVESNTEQPVPGLISD